MSLDLIKLQTIDSNINYWYEGFCPHSGELLKLPRTPLIETIAGELMQYLSRDEVYFREGKMYGVLLLKLDAEVAMR